MLSLFRPLIVPQAVAWFLIHVRYSVRLKVISDPCLLCSLEGSRNTHDEFEFKQNNKLSNH